MRRVLGRDGGPPGYKTLQLMEKEYSNIKKWSWSSAKKSKRIQHLYEKFGFVKVGENKWEYEYEKLIFI